uniref:Formin-like protein 5 n=1 Tax=Phascolarctos cinereus TaxID=38626 RepID=A0A6P5KB20_PHACI|nr:formin-like protein 5 [Phascolarctos cinereus]
MTARRHPPPPPPPAPRPGRRACRPPPLRLRATNPTPVPAAAPPPPPLPPPSSPPPLPPPPPPWPRRRCPAAAAAAEFFHSASPAVKRRRCYPPGKVSCPQLYDTSLPSGFPSAQKEGEEEKAGQTHLGWREGSKGGSLRSSRAGPSPSPPSGSCWVEFPGAAGGGGAADSGVLPPMPAARAPAHLSSLLRWA